jgi:hypothetical protein
MHDDVCDSPFEDEGRLSETSAEIFTARVIEAAAIEVHTQCDPQMRPDRGGGASASKYTALNDMFVLGVWQRALL